MEFDPEKNQTRRGNAERIREDDPTPAIWLTGYGYLRAAEEGLQMLNPDVPELLFQAGLINPTTPKLKTDISNAYEQVKMLVRPSKGRPTVRTVTDALAPFVKRHERRMTTEIGKEAIERAWRHVRSRLMSRSPVG